MGVLTVYVNFNMRNWKKGMQSHLLYMHNVNHRYGFSLHNIGINWNFWHLFSGTHSQQELKYLRAKTLVIQGWSSDHSQTDVEDVMAKL